jgi:hypothetical protein
MLQQISDNFLTLVDGAMNTPVTQRQVGMFQCERWIFILGLIVAAVFWCSALINLAWGAWSFSFWCAMCRKWWRIFMKAGGAGLRKAASNDG